MQPGSGVLEAAEELPIVHNGRMRYVTMALVFVALAVHSCVRARSSNRA